MQSLRSYHAEKSLPCSFLTWFIRSRRRLKTAPSSSHTIASEVSSIAGRVFACNSARPEKNSPEFSVHGFPFSPRILHGPFWTKPKLRVLIVPACSVVCVMLCARERANSSPYGRIRQHSRISERAMKSACAGCISPCRKRFD